MNEVEPQTVSEISFWLKTVVPIVMTGVITSLVGYWLANRKTKFENKEDSEFLAEKLAFHLEKYAIKAAKELSLTVLHQHSDGYLGKPNYGIPEIDQLPEDENYKLISSSLRSRAYSIPDEIDVRNMWISNDPSCANAEDHLIRTVPETAEVALIALKLAKDLRKAYKLPSRSLQVDQWNMEEFLEKSVNASSKSETD